MKDKQTRQANEMKERLARIAAWAKAHPWQTALILGAVILLGYLVYKRSGGGGGGGSSAGGAVSEPETPSPIQSGIPDLGSISSPVTSGGLSSTPSTETEMNPVTGSSVSIPKPSRVTPPGNLGSFGSDAWSPDFSASVTALTSPVAASVSEGTVKGVTPSKLKSGQLAANVKKNNPLAQRVANQTKGQTPAQALGKGRLYTGYINGQYYVNGFPVGSSPIPGTVTLPGGRVASKEILNIK